MDKICEIPITGMQRYIFDYQLNRPKSTMYNLCFLFKLSHTIDEGLFTKAVICAIEAHPILRSVFYFADDGELRQKEVADQHLDLVTEYVSEAELETIKTTLVQPFFLTNKVMYRCRLFKTELALYLLLDIHHSIIDGLSFQILLKDIAKAYRGQPVKPETYTYHHAAQDEFAMRESFKSFDMKQYYDELLQGWNGQALPNTDREVEDFSFADCYHILDFTVKELKPFLLRHSIDENVFFMTVMALSNAVYNDADDAVFYWIHNGRSSLKQYKMVGLIMKEHLVRIRLSGDMTIAELLAAVKMAKDNSMEDTFYPFYEHKCLTSKEEIPCFLFQGNLKNCFPIGGENFAIEELPDPYKAVQSSFDVEVEVDVEGEGYAVLVEYCAGLYREASIECWTKLFDSIANALMTADTVEEIRKQNG